MVSWERREWANRPEHRVSLATKRGLWTQPESSVLWCATSTPLAVLQIFNAIKCLCMRFILCFDWTECVFWRHTKLSYRRAFRIVCAVCVCSEEQGIRPHARNVPEIVFYDWAREKGVCLRRLMPSCCIHAPHLIDARFNHMESFDYYYSDVEPHGEAGRHTTIYSSIYSSYDRVRFPFRTLPIGFILRCLFVWNMRAY